MRITTKITLALSAVSLGVFGLYGVRLLERERAELRSVLEASSKLLARGLQVSVENALRDGQHEDVREVLLALRGHEPPVEVLITTPDGRAIAASPRSEEGLAALEEVAALARASGEPELRYSPEEAPRRVAVALAMRDDSGAPLGIVTLARSLDELRADLGRTTREVVLSVFLFVLATALLGHLLGRAYIRTPLGKLAAAMRMVRLGDLRSGVHVGQRDEMSSLGEEFNAMVRELRETRERLREESESKRRIEGGLQEASKLITIGQLAASLAHEIGSPLQVLGGRARLLLAKPDDPERVRHNARIVAEQTDRIAGILDQLLGLVRELPAPHGRIDMAASVRAVVELLEFEASRRGSSLELVVVGEPGPVEADAGQVQQVVLNLLTNALHATPAGGAIRVLLEPALLERPFGAPVAACRLSVEDDGHGIEPEIRARVFEPFFTSRAEEGGTGLGLAVVKAIVERHRGTLALASEPGRGTRVEALFPLEQAGASPERETPPSEEVGSR